MGHTGKRERPAIFISFNQSRPMRRTLMQSVEWMANDKFIYFEYKKHIALFHANVNTKIQKFVKFPMFLQFLD